MELERLLLSKGGGFPTEQEELDFMQDCMQNYVNALALALTYNAASEVKNIYITGHPVFPVDNGNGSECAYIRKGYVLLDGKLLWCPQQEVEGSVWANFWMVEETSSYSPKQFEDGAVRDTREKRWAKVVYSATEVAGGVRLSDFLGYSAILSNNGCLMQGQDFGWQSQLSNGVRIVCYDPNSYFFFGATASDLFRYLGIDKKTAWKDLILLNGWTPTNPGINRYRFNDFGHLEIEASICNESAVGAGVIEFADFQSSDMSKIPLNTHFFPCTIIRSGGNGIGAFFRIYSRRLRFFDRGSDSGSTFVTSNGLPAGSFLSLNTTIYI